jgi:hypothetical protein
MVAAGQWVGSSVAAASTPTFKPLTAAQASALSTNVNDKVIVVLKDQVGQDPASKSKAQARRSVESSEQQPLLNELHATHASNVKTYTTLNGIAATVSKGEAAHLAANPSVAEVIPDQIIHLANTFGPDTTSSTTSPSSLSRTPVAGTCSSNPNRPELEPQALSDIHADSSNANARTAASLGLTGSGVTVAFIADGLDINNQDFIRPDGTPVFVDYKDFSGEGTAVPSGGGEAFLDASSVAAQGRYVYNISHYSALPLNRPCYITVRGVAPGASLVGLDIFGAEDAGYNSSFLEAIDYAVSVDHVNVLNESLGNNYYPDDQASLDVIKAANDAAVAAGTTVTASSGDAGVTDTIGTPATDPNVIAVGASTTYEAPAQLGYAGFQFPGVQGYLNNNISSLSSSGFEQDGRTIDVVAPGELNWALCSTDLTQWDECADYVGQGIGVQESGGTSESAPLTAGVAALVIQAYAVTHGGADPSPALVKQFITSTADDINAPGDLQGAGLIDAYRAALAAEDYQAPPSSLGVILKSDSQLDTVGAEGATTTFRETLTNIGGTAQKVNLSSRQLGDYQSIYQTTVNLSDSASPHSTDYQGINDNYEVVHFTVPTGVDRLNGAIAFQATSSALASRVRMSLVDPNGNLADYSLPQGIGNYGDAQVANPAPGQWTAYIWSRDSADGGTTGPVLFGASVANYQTLGSLDRSAVTIAPGASKTVALTVTHPNQPGDVAGSLVIGLPGQVAATTVPVIIRTLIPSGTQSFSGTLTGGNGRASFTGVTEYYQMNVEPNSPELNVSLKLASNPDNQYSLWLVDPNGQAQAYQSNVLVSVDNSGALNGQNTLGANAHVLDPVAGRWTVIVVFAPTVSGKALSVPYTVSVDQTPAKATAVGVPQGQTYSVNHPAIVKVRVTNTGTGPEAYFIDGRTTATGQYQLVPLGSADTTVPLNFTKNVPVYLVPSQTSQIIGEAHTPGAEPIQFDLGAPSGDPDVASGQGKTVGAVVNGNPVSSGVWDIAPNVVGPFGSTGAQTETVRTQMVATTQGFDPAVSSDTGDLWQMAVGGPFTVTPVIVQPGHSATIPVLITPSGTAGTTVSGVIYLDDDSLVSVYSSLSPQANTVAAFPYSYTIGS